MRFSDLKPGQTFATIASFDALVDEHRAEGLIVVCADSPETFENAPVCVQVVGRTQEDEAVIGMAEIVDRAVKQYKATKGI